MINEPGVPTLVVIICNTVSVNSIFPDCDSENNRACLCLVFIRTGPDCVIVKLNSLLKKLKLGTWVHVILHFHGMIFVTAVAV